MRLIIHGMDRRVYLGDAEALPQANDPVVLENVWEVLVIDQHIGNPKTGEIVAATRRTMLMPVGTGSGALPELSVQPAAWYAVDGAEMENDFDALVQRAESAATEKQAARAGIELAGPGSIPGLGKLPTLKDLAGR